jgi:stage V sporulation protein S
MNIIRVSATSKPKAVAGAIAAVIRNGEVAEVQAIGASAVNQAAKSIAISRAYVADENIDIICRPEFVRIDINGEVKTAIKFRVTTA